MADGNDVRKGPRKYQNGLEQRREYATLKRCCGCHASTLGGQIMGAPELGSDSSAVGPEQLRGFLRMLDAMLIVYCNFLFSFSSKLLPLVILALNLFELWCRLFVQARVLRTNDTS